MDVRLLLGSFLVLYLGLGAECLDPPPSESSSYKAAGEMVETLEDESALLVQLTFEESFDAQTKNAAFRVRVMGKNVTFVENFVTGQTFQHDDKVCTLQSVEEWIKTKSPPSLLGYEDTNGTVRFSLKQLFSLDDKYLKESDVPDTYRGISARKWTYEIQGREQDDNSKVKITVNAYWSDLSWNTSSSAESVPLGFVVTKTTNQRGNKGEKKHEQFINVYSFAPGIVDHKLFEPIQGVVCENRSQTLQFPDVKNMKALALHSEVLFPDNLDIKYLDNWVDTQNKVIRMDMERIKDDVPIFEKKSRRFQSETVIGPMEVVFRMTYDDGRFVCSVIPFKDFEFDVQNLLSFKTPVRRWDISELLFGRNQTSYVYIGRSVKRDIPCHMFQGVRTDWPDPSSNVTSLWEWCFSINMTQQEDIVKFRNGDYGLVNAQVKVLQTGDPGMFYRGLRMIHHFYDVRVQDPAVVNPTQFDIGRCFEEAEKRRLQFKVDWAVTDDNVHLVENATSDAGFLQKWKNIIYQWSGLQPHTLRITQVQGVLENATLYIKFVVLVPHPQLPEDIKTKQKSAFEAEKIFRDSVNDGKVFVSYLPSKKSNMQKLYALKHSVEFQINKTFVPHIPDQETTPEISTRPGFSLITVPDNDGSTGPDTSGSTKDDEFSPKTPWTEPTLNPEPLVKKNLGHSPATVATVSVAMLLIGISMGATGIFVKYYGLPACLKGGT